MVARGALVLLAVNTLKSDKLRWPVIPLVNQMSRSLGQPHKTIQHKLHIDVYALLNPPCHRILIEQALHI